MTTRLSVNINEECENSLKAYMEAHNVTATEAIRRAISVLNYVDVLELEEKFGQD